MLPNNNSNHEDIYEEQKDLRNSYVAGTVGDAAMKLAELLHNFVLSEEQIVMLNTARAYIIEQKAYKPILFLDGNIYKDATEDACLAGQLMMLDIILTQSKAES